jgi:hypothetical protein
MSEGNFDDNVGDIVQEYSRIHFSFINFFYLKYFFIFVLVFSFLFMMLGKNSNKNRRRKSSRRNFTQIWNNEKKEKIKELTKKSVDIKDFKKYKPSDVENITLLNTLINAYISKVYEEITSSGSKGNRLNSQNLSSNSNESSRNQEQSDADKLSQKSLSKLNSEINAENNPSNTTNSDINLQMIHRRKDGESLSASNEVEQGSHIDCDYQDYMNNTISDLQKTPRQKSILKQKKNVCFKLDLNQEFHLSERTF